MNIIDLNEENVNLYCLCLEDWSDEIKEAGEHKRIWYEKMRNNRLKVKLALDEKGVVGGMIQYVPVEYAPVIGEEMYFIYCIWIHGYKKGRGNFQKKGMGKALLKAAEDDVRAMGAKGIIAWGISLPFWMKASWFKRHGYRKADKQGMRVLLWKSFTEDAVKPAWIRQTKTSAGAENKITVTGFINGWCPAQNLVFERAKRAASECGDKVIFQEINTFDRDVLLEWGISDGLFINDKQVRTGPPPSFEKIKKLIRKKVR